MDFIIGYSLYTLVGCTLLLVGCFVFIAIERYKEKRKISDLVEDARMRAGSRTDTYNDNSYTNSMKFNIASKTVMKDHYLEGKYDHTMEQKRVIDAILVEDYNTDFDKHFN